MYLAEDEGRFGTHLIALHGNGPEPYMFDLSELLEEFFELLLFEVDLDVAHKNSPGEFLLLLLLCLDRVLGLLGLLMLAWLALFGRLRLFDLGLLGAEEPADLGGLRLIPLVE